MESTDRMAEIYVMLEQIDLKSIRPLREGDATRLAELNLQAQSLRTELAALIAGG